MPNVRNCPKILGQRKGQGRYDKSGKKAPAAAVAATPAHAHKAEVVAEVDSNAVDYDEGAGEEHPWRLEASVVVKLRLLEKRWR